MQKRRRQAVRGYSQAPVTGTYPPLGKVPGVGLRRDEHSRACKVQQPKPSRAEDVPAMPWHGYEARPREGLGPAAKLQHGLLGHPPPPTQPSQSRSNRNRHIHIIGSRVWGLGLSFSGLGFRAQVLGFGV